MSKKFFKHLFSSHSTTVAPDKRKLSKSRQDVSQSDTTSLPPDLEEREFSVPYDTRRKMSTSRSGRMKHNQKIRGTLRKDLYGDTRFEEKSNIEYHVHGRTFTQELFQQPSEPNNDENNIKKSLENIYRLAKQEDDEFQNKNNKTVTSENGNAEPGDETIDMDLEIENMFKPVLIETTF